MRPFFLLLLLSSFVAFSQGTSTTKKNVIFLSLDKIAGEVITFTGRNVKMNEQDWYEKFIFLNDSEILRVEKSQFWSKYEKREDLTYKITKSSYRRENNKVFIELPKIKLRIYNNKVEVDSSSSSRGLMLGISDDKQHFDFFYYEELEGGIQFSNKSRYLIKSLNKLSSVYSNGPYPSSHNPYIGKILSKNKYEIIKEIINLGVWSLLDLSDIENIGNLNINEELQKYDRIKEIERRYGMKSSEPVKRDLETYEPPVDPDAKGPELVEPPKPAEEEIFTAVEQQVEFPGGPHAFLAFLQKNLQYPAAAQQANVGGKVYVQFVVNTDGTIQDVQVLKSVGYGCDEEAVRVIKSVPRWTPGKQSGRLVRSRFTQPILFVLPEKLNIENQTTEIRNKTEELIVTPFFKLPNIRRGLKIVE